MQKAATRIPLVVIASLLIINSSTAALGLPGDGIMRFGEVPDPPEEVFMGCDTPTGSDHTLHGSKGIAFDADSGELFLLARERYQPGPLPPGTPPIDTRSIQLLTIDIDCNISDRCVLPSEDAEGLTLLPGGHLLVAEGDRLSELDKNCETISSGIACSLEADSARGVAFHPGRGSIFVVGDGPSETEDLVRELDLETCSEIERFQIDCEGASGIAVDTEREHLLINGECSGVGPVRCRHS